MFSGETEEGENDDKNTADWPRSQAGGRWTYLYVTYTVLRYTVPNRGKWSKITSHKAM